MKPINDFKNAISTTTKRKELKQLWLNPLVQAWFAGKPIEISEGNETRSIMIDEEELFDVYLSILKIHHSPLAEQFWDNNPRVAKKIKQIAVNKETCEPFLCTLLAADVSGSSRHIYTVLQFFPHDLLQEIKSEAESLPNKSTYKKGQIRVLDAVLTNKPYKTTKSEKKSTDPFLRTFQIFKDKLAQREFKTMAEISAYDSTVLPWFFGKDVLDTSTGRERKITSEGLIDFFRIVLKIKNQKVMMGLTCDNEALVDAVTSLPQEEIKALLITVTASSTHGNSQFIHQFFSSVVSHEPGLKTLLQSMKKEIEEENQGVRLSEYKQGQLKVLSTYAKEKKVSSEKPLQVRAKRGVKSALTKRNRQDVFTEENKKSSPKPKKRFEEPMKETSPIQDAPIKNDREYHAALFGHKVIIRRSNPFQKNENSVLSPSELEREPLSDDLKEPMDIDSSLQENLDNTFSLFDCLKPLPSNPTSYEEEVDQETKDWLSSVLN